MMEDVKNTAYLGIGSNIGDRFTNLQSAVDSLKLLPKTMVTAASPVFETEPVGYIYQRKFYNAAVRVKTGLSPVALLGALLGIEAAMGRSRLIKDGPRNIDIDLLLYENIEITTEELTVPHPRMFERDFVTVPLGYIVENEKYKTKLMSADSSKITEIEGIFLIV